MTTDEELGNCMKERAAAFNLVHEQQSEIERLKIGHVRYETARLMNPQQWAAAWELNISTGKPFDEIIDHMRPFMKEQK